MATTKDTPAIHDPILAFDRENTRTDLPDIRPGMVVRVHWSIRERGKERIQPYEGIVIRVSGTGPGKSFTVRRVTGGIGIERIFPCSSPLLKSVDIVKTQKVRRAVLSFLRAPHAKRLRRATTPNAKKDASTAHRTEKKVQKEKKA